MASPIKSELDKVGKKVIKEARSMLTRRRKNASRELYNSLSYKIVNGVLEFSFAKEGEYVELGRRKGAKMPPISPIEKWAKQKGLEQFRDKKGRYISNRARAFLIARGISAKGIKPLAFFSDPFERAMRDFPEVIAEAYVKVIEAELNDVDSTITVKG